MPNADIEKRLETLNQAQEDQKVQRGMLADALKQDAELAKLEEAAQMARKKYAAHKEALLNEPELRKLQEKLADIAVEVRDTKALLADELIGHFMQTKSTEYIDGKGKKHRIQLSAKLARENADEA